MKRLVTPHLGGWDMIREVLTAYSGEEVLKLGGPWECPLHIRPILYESLSVEPRHQSFLKVLQGIQKHGQAATAIERAMIFQKWWLGVIH